MLQDGNTVNKEKLFKNTLDHVLKTYDFYGKSRQSAIYRGYATNNSTISYSRPYRSIEDRWIETYMMRRQILNRVENVYDGRARITLPKGDQILNLIYPRYEQVIFGNRDFFSVTGFEEGDKDAADKLKKLLYWNIEKINGRSKFAKAIKEMANTGTCILKMKWVHGYEEEVVRRPLHKLYKEDKKEFGKALMGGKFSPNSLVSVKTKKLTNDNFDFDVLDTAMFYMNPVVEGIQNSPTIEKKYVTHNDLTKIKHYDQAKVKKCKDCSVAYDDYDFYIQERQRLAGINNLDSGELLTGTEADVDGKKHQLLIFWGMYKIDPDDKDENGNVIEHLCEIHVLDKLEVVLMRKSPFNYKHKPYVIGRYQKENHEAYGIDALYPVMRLLVAANTSASQMQDNMNLVLAPPLLKRTTVKLPSIMRLIPGQTINIPENYDPTKDLRTLDIKDVTQSAREGINFLFENIESGTGAVRLLSGMSSGGGFENTASGVMAAVNEANMRFKSGIFNFQEDVIRETVRWNVKLDQQFMSESKQVRILNPVDPEKYESVNVSPQDIQIDCDIIPNNASTELDRIMELDAFTKFFQVANHYINPVTKGFDPAMEPVIEKIWHATNNKDWERWKPQMIKEPQPQGPSAQEQDVQRKADKDQMDFAVAQEKINVDKVRIFTDFVTKIPDEEPDPQKADMYKRIWIDTGGDPEMWDEAEEFLYGGQYKAMEVVK